MKATLLATLGLVLCLRPPPAPRAQPAWAERRATFLAVPAFGGAQPVLVENVGQFGAGARFQMRGDSVTLWLTEDALWITAVQAEAHANGAGSFDFRGAARADSPVRPGVALKLSFEGSNPHPRMEPIEKVASTISYFLGNDPEEWYAGVPAWSGVRYVDLWPGVDLEVRGESGGWTWRLIRHGEGIIGAQGIAAPGLALRVEGAESLSVDGAYLRARTAVGDVILPLLVIDSAESVSAMAVPCPTIDGAVVLNPFATRTSLEDGERLASQDASDLAYSTFLGTSDYDAGYGVVVDDAGNIYVTGETGSASFPTTAGPFDASYGGGYYDVFVAKLNPAASGQDALVYSTFLGGSGDDRSWGIVLDSSGTAYVEGYTASSDFPTTVGAFDRSLHGGKWDVFVAGIDSSGTALRYSTFLGGSKNDYPGGIASDAEGNVYVTGDSESSDFPVTAGAYDTSHGGWPSDAFVAKFRPAGNGQSDLLYSTFLGGSKGEHGFAIAVDGSGSIYLTGDTASPEFPTTAGAYDTEFNHSDAKTDAFLVKVNPAGNGQSDLLYSSFLGGSYGDDQGRGIALDGSGNVYMTGQTYSTNFPTTQGAYDTGHNGSFDVFVARLSLTGSGQSDLLYSTFLGGSGQESGQAIAVDASGRAYVTGYTWSSDFPTTDGAYDTSYNGGYYGDAFAARFSAAGDSLVYSTFLGGSASEIGRDIAVDGWGNAYVTGQTPSSDFPSTAGAYDSNHNGEPVVPAR